MATLFIGGLMFVGLAFLARKIEVSSERVEHQDKVSRIEQEMQRTKDKILLEMPW